MVVRMIMERLGWKKDRARRVLWAFEPRWPRELRRQGRTTTRVGLLFGSSEPSDTNAKMECHSRQSGGVPGSLEAGRGWKAGQQLGGDCQGLGFDFPGTIQFSDVRFQTFETAGTIPAVNLMLEPE